MKISNLDSSLPTQFDEVKYTSSSAIFDCFKELNKAHYSDICQLGRYNYQAATAFEFIIYDPAVKSVTEN